MSSVEQQFLQLWSSNAPRVALWADSSYGPFEEREILKLANELNFPIVHFTAAFGGGLTVKADFHDPAGKPESVVVIESGYNDESNLSSADVLQKMRKQQWYKVLAQSASVVKFVIFVHQPSYKQVCPPKKKNHFNAGWKSGTLLEGSKYTAQAMQLCQQELGIPALCMQCNSAQEMFAEMLINRDGEVWQNEAVSRCAAMCTKKSPDYNPAGQLAHWEDSQHPTALGAELHFRCLVKALQARCLNGGFRDASQLGDPLPPLVNTVDVAPQAAWANQAAASAQVSSSAPQTSWQNGAAAWTTNDWMAWAQELWSGGASWNSQEAGASWNSQQATWGSHGQSRSQPY